MHDDNGPFSLAIGLGIAFIKFSAFAISIMVVWRYFDKSFGVHISNAGLILTLGISALCFRLLGSQNSKKWTRGDNVTHFDAPIKEFKIGSYLKPHISAIQYDYYFLIQDSQGKDREIEDDFNVDLIPQPIVEQIGVVSSKEGFNSTQEKILHDRVMSMLPNNTLPILQNKNRPSQITIDETQFKFGTEGFRNNGITYDTTTEILGQKVTIFTRGGL